MRLRVAAGADAVLAAVPALPAPASGAPAPKPNPRQWYLTSWNVERDVWPISQGAGVKVAIVDTGVDDGYRLREMRDGVVLPGVDIPRQQQDSDGRYDINGHGTEMGLLVAGRGIGGGAAGIAPEATILPVRISTGVDTREGIRWAADKGAKVINLSVAHIRVGEECSPAMQEALNYAIERDVVIVASAGNSGNGDNLTEEPSSCPGVVAVGAWVPRSGRCWTTSSSKSPTAARTARTRGSARCPPTGPARARRRPPASSSSCSSPAPSAAVEKGAVCRR